MQLSFKSFFYAAAAAAAIVNASTIGSDSVDGPEAIPAGTICTGTQLGGTCTTLSVLSVPSACLTLPSGFSGSISSMSLNPGFACTFYITEKCGGAGGWVVVRPTGIAEFLNTDYNDSLTCYICLGENDVLPSTHPASTHSYSLAD
ncbi:hypothetical protein BDP27DRAFT_1451109 [Rhodocollybia butyracea]|uniref:Uncharacterized protein n=1 Tax=Rhodocollybia butyracea TaxID=206335 RepID=A0A9P5PJH9_9AGAR|nr:hypothetical protein BDP27DRAFT_1451109 [Rhodocollybia butyracea]